MAEIHSIKDAFRDPLIIALVLVGIASVLWGAVSSVRSHYQNSQEVRATNQPPADDKPQSTQSDTQAPAITEQSIEAPATGETTEPAAPAAPAAEEPAAETPAAHPLRRSACCRGAGAEAPAARQLRRACGGTPLHRKHLLPRRQAAPETTAAAGNPLTRSACCRGACGGNASGTGSSASGRDAARG